MDARVFVYLTRVAGCQTIVQTIIVYLLYFAIFTAMQQQ